RQRQDNRGRPHKLDIVHPECRSSIQRVATIPATINFNQHIVDEKQIGVVVYTDRDGYMRPVVAAGLNFNSRSKEVLRVAIPRAELQMSVVGHQGAAVDGGGRT